MVGALFSSDAWNNVTFTAGEVRNPRRNLPLSLALGVGIVSRALHRVQFRLPQCAAARSDSARSGGSRGDRRGRAYFGPVAVQFMAAAIMVSTFGCANGMILAGARVYYAMALDGLFFRGPANSTRVHHTPVFALAIQCVWAPC